MLAAKQKLSGNLKKRQELKLVDIEPVPERIKNFPTTRYYGSKRKLLPWIFENIKMLNFNTVLDGFGGTGSVSLLFKAMNKDVTYHDAFSFSNHVGQTVLSDSLCISNETFAEFVNETIPRNGLIYKTFKGLYYKDEENRWLDGFATKVFSSRLTDQEISLYMYTLYQACLKKRPFNIFHRTNLNLRLNKNVKRKFGNLTTWEHPFTKLMIKSYEEISPSLWRSRGIIKILKPSSITSVRKGYDLVYLDPPYISLVVKNNRDGYWKRYHFLEGLSQYQEWHRLIDKKSYLKSMPTPKRFLDWSQKKTFRDRLYALIKKHRQSIVVLSYVSNSYPDESDIGTFFKTLFSETSIHSKDHPHALSKEKKRELLFIGRP
ncbi:MAG: DNA adenine methylase [Nitrospinae bacterium]|nr:DNA adenine methylase [Nitrospinota bacterium]